MQRHKVYRLVRETKTRFVNISVATVLAVTGIGGSLPLLLAQTANATTSANAVYDALPDVSTPVNYPSQAFEATSTSEFGDYIHLGGSSRVLDSVTVTMSNWAKYADYASDPLYSGNTATWTLPVTLNVYSNAFNADGAPTNKIATVTQTVTVPWRPAGDPSCAATNNGTGWKVGDVCYNFSGIAFNASFDLSSLNVTLPDDIVVSVAYNTQHYGYTPTGVSGPYNSLNVAVPKSQAISVGSDDSVDKALINSTWSGAYGDGGSTGIFRQASDWTPYGTVSLKVTATAPPTVSPCTTTATVKSTSLSSWSLSETRSAGHNEVAAGGLHIWTDTGATGSPDPRKAAGYYSTDFPLSGLGDQTIASSIDYQAIAGITPGLQLVTDFNGDGTPDGILVGESVYGNDWWLSTSAAQFVKDNAPNTGGGNGSNWFGTPNEWLASFPNAEVRAIGYSLGSGVDGNGIIKRITLGCTNYTFGLAAPTNLQPPTGTITTDPAFVNKWDVVEGAHSYEYRTANVLSGSADLGPIIYSDSSISQPGRYSTNGSTVTRQNGGTPDNDYYWQVRAVDSFGNPGPWSVINKVTVDQTKPATPTLLTPTNGGYETTNDFYFTWTNSGDSGTPVHYEFQSSQNGHTSGGVLDTSVWNNIANGNSEQSNLTTPQIHSTGAPDGDWYWQVRAIDAAGNTSDWSSVWKMTIDTQTPDVPTATLADQNGNSVAANGYITTKHFTFTLNNTATDVARYQLKYWNSISGSAFNGEANAWPPSDISGYSTSPAQLTKYVDQFTQGEGTHYFAFSACDAAGHCSSYSSPFTVTYDHTAPAVPTGLGWTTTLGVTVPSGGSTNEYGGTASWGSASSDVDHYIYKYWNDIVGNPYKVGSEYTTPVSGTSLPGVFNQGDGVHHFCVQAVDAAGNTSACSAPFTITYDATAPTTPVATPGAGTYDTAQLVSLASTDAGSTPTIYYTTDGSDPSNKNGTMYAGAFTVSGSKTVKAIAYDSAGNTSDILTADYTITSSASGDNGSVLGDETSNPQQNGGSTGNSSSTGSSSSSTNSTSGGGDTTGEVLGTETTTPEDTSSDASSKGQVKSLSTVSKTDESGQNSGRFLGLGWWWLPILALLAGFFWFLLGRRRHGEEQ